ncbi:MAG: hypothetical protein KDC39_06855 [Actinobacteria bacterium]|nr:hypothetical protein [Actinomycetota bacterium]
MRKLSWLVLASVFLMLAGSLTTANAVPRGFVKHTEGNFVWFGPRSWGAAEGQNDIWISSPTGTQYLHYGAGGAACAYPPLYSDPAGFFSYLRSGYLNTARENFSLYSKGLRRARYTRVGRIQTINANYLRQRSTFTGIHRGKRIRGEMILDFFAVGGGVCGNRQQVRAAPQRGFGRSIRQLREVQKYIFGPKDATGTTPRID